MFVVTLNRARLRQIGVGAMCCAVVVCSALLGRYISTRTVEAAAGAAGQKAKIETAQDIQTWFTGYGIEVDGASITADKVKIPRKWDDSFSAFNTVVGQSGLDLERLIPSASTGEESCYGVLLVYKKKPVGAYLLAKPSGLVTGLGDAQAAMAETAASAEQAAAAAEQPAAADPGEPVQETSGEPEVYEESTAPYTDLPLDLEGYPVE